MLIWTNFDLLLHIEYKQLVSKISFANRSYASFFVNTKGPGTSFQAAVFVKNFDKIFPFVIWHKLTKFHEQTVFTSQVIQ